MRRRPGTKFGGAMVTPPSAHSMLLPSASLPAGVCPRGSRKSCSEPSSLLPAAPSRRAALLAACGRRAGADAPAASLLAGAPEQARKARTHSSRLAALAAFPDAVDGVSPARIKARERAGRRSLSCSLMRTFALRSGHRRRRRWQQRCEPHGGRRLHGRGVLDCEHRRAGAAHSFSSARMRPVARPNNPPFP